MEEKQNSSFGSFLNAAYEMNRMRYLGTRGYEHGSEERPLATRSEWVPNADVFLRGRDLVVRVQLAGVGREDIEVTLRDDVLSVCGERRGNPEEEEAGEVYRRELFYGPFRRDVRLPSGTDGDGIEAVFEAGMVEITVPDAGAREPLRIEVR